MPHGHGVPPPLHERDLLVERRHLEQGTRAVLYLLKNQKRDEWLKAQQALKEAANKARSETVSTVAATRSRNEKETFQPGSLSPDKRPGKTGRG